MAGYIVDVSIDYAKHVLVIKFNPTYVNVIAEEVRWRVACHILANPFTDLHEYIVWHNAQDANFPAQILAPLIQNAFAKVNEQYATLRHEEKVDAHIQLTEQLKQYLLTKLDAVFIEYQANSEYTKFYTGVQRDTPMDLYAQSPYFFLGRSATPTTPVSPFVPIGQQNPFAADFATNPDSRSASLGSVGYSPASEFVDEEREQNPSPQEASFLYS